MALYQEMLELQELLFFSRSCVPDLALSGLLVRACSTRGSNCSRENFLHCISELQGSGLLHNHPEMSERRHKHSKRCGREITGSFFQPGQLYFYLSLSQRPYLVKRFGFIKCYSRQLLGIAPPKPWSQAGTALRREQSLQGRAEGKSAPGEGGSAPSPEMGVEGSAGTGEGGGEHPWEIGNCWDLCSAAPPHQAVTITRAAPGFWIPEKPGRCCSSPGLFLALPGGDFHVEQDGERARSCSSRVFGEIRHHQQCHERGELKRELKHTRMQENSGRAGKFGKSSEKTPEG